MKGKQGVPVDLQQVVMDELHGLVAPADVRRVFASLAEVVPRYVRQERTVRLPGFVRIRAEALKQRKFESNLPHLRGQPFVSRPRWKLAFEPEGQLRLVLRPYWDRPQQRVGVLATEDAP